MLASVVAEYDRDRVRLVEMDIETDADTADALGVAGTPTALFYARPRARRGGEDFDDETGNEAQTADDPTGRRAASRRWSAAGRKRAARRDALDEILGEGARVDGPRRRFGNQGSG